MAEITVTMGSSTDYPGPTNDTGNAKDTYELRTRLYTVDVDGVDFAVTKRDGGMYVVAGRHEGANVVINLPDPGTGFEVRYSTGGSNPTHKSSLYSTALTFAENQNNSDNTIFKFRVYNSVNHTIHGDIVSLEFNAH